ncbi:hypothetical protein ACE38W_17640 [Chitinophaga sp. Hz27]|uniref:hypothetical protein n=1 Tax=Chitinophaga sp. Hz27 TaxID=3347169 RepID=UPI0035D9193C
MRRLLYSLLGIVFLLSCNKTDKLKNTPAKPNQLITDAKYYVDSIRQEVFPNGRSATGSDSILWGQAIIRHFSKIDAVSVPLFSDSTQKGTFDNHILPLKLENYLLVYKGSDSNFHYLVMKLIRTSSRQEGFTGAVMLEDLTGNKLTAYIMENGQIVKMPAPQGSGNNNARAVYSCITINYYYSVNGGPWQYNFSNTYCNWYDVADNGGSNLPVGNQELPPDNGGGGVDMSGNTPGNNNAAIPSTLRDVRMNIKGPCLTSTVSMVTFNGLSSYLAQTFNGTFNVGDEVDCEFKDSTFADVMMDGLTDRYLNINNGTKYLSVRININTVLNNASQEYIAATIYHEITHGILFAKTASTTNEQDHETMSSGFYFDVQVAALQALFPNLSLDDAKILVWIGLDKSDAYKALPNSYKDNVDYVARKYRNGTLGTKCN